MKQDKTSLHPDDESIELFCRACKNIFPFDKKHFAILAHGGESSKIRLMCPNCSMKKNYNV